MSLFVTQNMFSEISKEELFRTPTFISAKVSPDGAVIARVGADESGIPNVFVSKRNSQSSELIQLTFFKTPEIIQFFWSADSSKVLLLKDENGTGQLTLHGFDIRSKEHLLYTEKFPKVNAKVIQISSKENKAVIGLNNRNPHFHDLHVLDLDTGSLSLLFENDTYAKFLVDENLKLILKMRINDDGSWIVLTGISHKLCSEVEQTVISGEPNVFDGKVCKPFRKNTLRSDGITDASVLPEVCEKSRFTDKDEIFMELSSEDAFQTEFLSYDAEKNAIYMLDNRFSNTNQLILKPLSNSNREKVLGGVSNSDVDEVLFMEGEPKAYASYYTQKKWHVLDPSIKEDITFLEKQVGSNFELVSQSKNDRVWIISNSIPDKGTHFWVYDRHPRNLSLLYSPSSDSSIENFSKMYEMIVKARDGETLVCYYTLPKEYDKGGRVDSPIPLVVVPHGGPFKVRDKFEFNLYHQWLASCGYAVLSVNFRLSSGFGKAFVNAGNGQWGGKAHLDVIDAVEACIAKGITQKGKLAIFGGSYGGYESLAALTFTPEYFTCCVALCGPSNLKTVLDSVPKFWEFTTKPLSDKKMFFTKQAFITSMGGNPDEMEGAEYLEKCSPLNHLDKIKAPLLLVHGQNDHVVNEGESRQIYESMKKNNKNVTYILFPDEGHRFAKFSNKMMFLNHAELFLSQHLHGKYQPSEQKVIADSSAKVFN